MLICVFLVLPTIIFGQTPDQEALCARMVGLSKPLECLILEAKKNSTERLPSNCYDILKRANGNITSGMYEIKSKFSKKPLMVNCDMDTEAGGWIVIQNRIDSSVDFYREWRDYKFGFGDLKGEFWIGLENIHIMTDLELRLELLVEVVDRDKKKFRARYNHIVIGPEKEGYTLSNVIFQGGTAGDSLIRNRNMKFSTRDTDQDTDSKRNCAEVNKGGWWFNDCGYSFLNGKFMNLPQKTYEGILWLSMYKEYKLDYILNRCRMLIRPIQGDLQDPYRNRKVSGDL